MVFSAGAIASDSIDSDGDGVANLVDDCPLSPRGSRVDSSGCALDEDTDGIADGLDQCPGTRFGVAADSLGCSAGQQPQGSGQISQGTLLAPLPATEPEDDDDWWTEDVPNDSAVKEFSAPDGARITVSESRPRPVILAPAPARPDANNPPKIASRESLSGAPVSVPEPRPEVTATRPVPPGNVAEPASPKVDSSPVTVTSQRQPPVVRIPAPQVSQSYSRNQAPRAEVRPRIVQRIEPDRSFFFEGRKAEISQTMARDVRQLADKIRLPLQEDPKLKLILSGHGDIKTDGQGADDVAAARAASIKSELEEAGVPEGRIVVQVPGIFEPRYYGEELSKNARVEIRLSNRIQGDSVRPPLTRGPVSSSPGAVLPGAKPLSSLGVVSRADLDAVSNPIGRSQNSVTVVFKHLGAALDTPSRDALRGFLESQTRYLLADPGARLSIRGGTGVNESGPQANRLAASRAATVKNYLEILGLPRNRVDLSVEELPRLGGQRVEVRFDR